MTRSQVHCTWPRTRDISYIRHDRIMFMIIICTGPRTGDYSYLPASYHYNNYDSLNRLFFAQGLVPGTYHICHHYIIITIIIDYNNYYSRRASYQGHTPSAVGSRSADFA